MIDTLTPTATAVQDATRFSASPSARSSEAPVFAGLMDRARSEGGTIEEQLREASEKLVSSTFIMPLFEQLRNDPLAANLVHGGRGESVFRQQLDQVLSDRIAGASNFDLVDSVYNQLSKGLTTGKVVDVNG